MKTISLYKIDDFTRGQMCGILNSALANISSITDFDYGASGDDKAKLNQAYKLIHEVVDKYGLFKEEK
jgi:hypothetical protein